MDLVGRLVKRIRQTVYGHAYRAVAQASAMTLRLEKGSRDGVPEGGGRRMKFLRW